MNASSIRLIVAVSTILLLAPPARAVVIATSKGIGADERSLTIRLEYRSDERTLIETEVDEVHEQLVATVEKDLNIRRRF